MDDLLQQSKENVVFDTASMSFIHHHHTVLIELTVKREEREKTNRWISHHLAEKFLDREVLDLTDLAIAIKPIVEMNAISDFFSQNNALLFRHTLGYRSCCNSSWLNMSNWKGFPLVYRRYTVLHPPIQLPSNTEEFASICRNRFLPE